MEKEKLILELGKRCNNNCIDCIHEESMQPLSYYLDFINNNKNSTSLDIIGGDPLCNKDVFKIIKHAVSAEIRDITIITNGRLLSIKKNAKKLIKAGVSKIIIKLFSHERDVHDKLTKTKNSFDQMISGFKNSISLKKEFPKLKVGCNILLNKRNIRNVSRTVGYMKNEGADFVNIIPSMKSFGRSLKTEEYPSLSSKEIAESLKNVEGIKASFIEKCVEGLTHSHTFEKDIKIACNDGIIRSMKDYSNGRFIRRNDCVECLEKDSCPGFMIDKENVTKISIISDLHISEKNKEIPESILKNACKLSENVILAGDIVEGEKDESSFDIFSEIIDKIDEIDKINYVAGNHEYIYGDSIDKYSLEKYKSSIEPEMFFRKDIGNIRAIFASLDGGPNKISKECAEFINNNLSEDENTINMIVTHFPQKMIEAINKKNIDIWISGHKSFKNDGDYRDICIDEGNIMIFAGIESDTFKIIELFEGSNTLRIRRHSCSKNKFIDIRDFKIKKHFRKNG